MMSGKNNPHHIARADVNVIWPHHFAARKVPWLGRCQRTAADRAKRGRPLLISRLLARPRRRSTRQRKRSNLWREFPPCRRRRPRFALAKRRGCKLGQSSRRENRERSGYSLATGP